MISAYLVPTLWVFIHQSDTEMHGFSPLLFCLFICLFFYFQLLVLWFGFHAWMQSLGFPLWPLACTGCLFSAGTAVGSIFSYKAGTGWEALGPRPADPPPGRSLPCSLLPIRFASVDSLLSCLPPSLSQPHPRNSKSTAMEWRWTDSQAINVGATVPWMWLSLTQDPPMSNLS